MRLDDLFPGTDPVLLDGAVGSRLREDGWPVDRPTVLANIDAPALVAATHVSHREAGARVLLTNTFCALLVSGRRCTQAVAAGARIARKAAGQDLRVAGSVAAFGLAVADPQLETVVRVLLDEGVDLLVFETCNTLRDASSAVELLERVAPRTPAVVCASSTDGGHEDAERVGAILAFVQATGLERLEAGLNCCRGPHEALKLATSASPGVRWVKPNTGAPSDRGSDALMGAFARAAVQEGARYVGACCGSSADTLTAMRAALRP